MFHVQFDFESCYPPDNARLQSSWNHVFWKRALTGVSAYIPVYRDLAGVAASRFHFDIFVEGICPADIHIWQILVGNKSFS